jgi:hypothetical protein
MTPRNGRHNNKSFRYTFLYAIAAVSMKSLLILFGCVVCSCFGQQPTFDKALFGVWNLDLSKSKFAGGNAPKGGQAIFNQNGYLVTFQDPPAGVPHIYAAAIIHGECYLIGSFPPTFSCTANIESPRRGTLGIMPGDAVVVKLESELVGETTVRVKNTLVSPTGEPSVVELVYTKAMQPMASTKK